MVFSIFGRFQGGTGAIFGSFGKEAVKMFEDISSTPSIITTANSNIQGVYPGDYATAINLLGNQDPYNFNVIYAPGVNSQNAAATSSAILNLAQDRGDAIAVIDMVSYGAQINAVLGQANLYDNSYDS